MSKRSRNGSGIVLALLGLVVGGIELTRYWQADHPIHWIPMVVAAILFFVGGAIIDTVKAMQIGNAVVSGAVTVIGALPLGRRQTDRLADAGKTIVIPPTGEHPVPATSALPPSETDIFPEGRGVNDQVGGIL